ncbi:MAG: hypothetical protein H6707_00665 [Deltaproteobacteria bacterium]|nr:hypothetical protein [Deltaproteobacteria bacterium]
MLFSTDERRLLSLAFFVALVGVGCASSDKPAIKVDIGMIADLQSKLDAMVRTDATSDMVSDSKIVSDAAPDTLLVPDTLPLPDAFQVDAGPVGVLCSNTCATANDGECDDGGPWSDTSHCALGTDCADCLQRTTATCGDGKRDPGETCDDANSLSGDGCDAFCQVESGYTCTLGAAWAFPAPTPDDKAGEVATNWGWTAALAQGFERTYQTDEATCLGGYLKSTHFISIAPSGCASIGSSGGRWFRVTFQLTQKELDAGPIVVGLGWDNFLRGATINGKAYPTTDKKLFGDRDGWPAPTRGMRLSQKLGLKLGANEIIFQLHEVGGGGTGNYTGFHLSMLDADSCTPTTTTTDAGIVDASTSDAGPITDAAAKD